MKTVFKVFKGYWDTTQLEKLIKRYQEELRLEVKNVIVLRNDDDDFSIGVIFEKGSEYENTVQSL